MDEDLAALLAGIAFFVSTIGLWAITMVVIRFLRTMHAIRDQLRMGWIDAFGIYRQLISAERDRKKGNTVPLEELMKKIGQEVE